MDGETEWGANANPRISLSSHTLPTYSLLDVHLLCFLSVIAPNPCLVFVAQVTEIKGKWNQIMEWTNWTRLVDRKVSAYFNPTTHPLPSPPPPPLCKTRKTRNKAICPSKLLYDHGCWVGHEHSVGLSEVGTFRGSKERRTRQWWYGRGRRSKPRRESLEEDERFYLFDC